MIKRSSTLLIGCLKSEDRIAADGGCGWKNEDEKLRIEKKKQASFEKSNAINS